MASIRYCTCDNRGYRIEMIKSVIRKWVSGTQQDVARYTCPACGAAETVVDTHGTGITQAEMTALDALTCS